MKATTRLLEFSAAAAAASSSRAPRRRIRPSALHSHIPPSQDLIGPPCPLSNLRPVYYSPLFPELHSSPSRERTQHPYSLAEFPNPSPVASTSSLFSSSSSSTAPIYVGPTKKHIRLQALKRKLQAQDLEYRLALYRFDAFNQNFWAKTNTNFLQARDRWVESNQAKRNATQDVERVDAVGDSASEEDVELAPFYKLHLQATKSVYAEYNSRLWRETAALMWPAVKAAWRRRKWRWEVWKAGGEI